MCAKVTNQNAVAYCTRLPHVDHCNRMYDLLRNNKGMGQFMRLFTENTLLYPVFFADRFRSFATY